MGNCQAAEAATVVIQHPPAAGNNTNTNTKRVDRIYWSVRAHEVMNSNPGHYVALVVPPPPTEANGQSPAAKQVLKLLKPDDTLLIGQVYRLISFEDVLKEFATKKSVKLGKLLKERGGGGTPAGVGGGGLGPEIKRMKNSGEEWGSSGADTEEVNQQLQLGISSSSSFNGAGGSSSRVVRRQHYYNYGGGQWRPALQSISEIA